MSGPRGALELLENKKVWELSDHELLLLLQHRRGELAIAQAFEGIVKFLLLIKSKGRDALWIEEAVQFVKLYSQNYAPGNSAHPFKDFERSVTIMRAARPTTADVTPSRHEINGRDQNKLELMAEQRAARLALPAKPAIPVNKTMPKMHRVMVKIKAFGSEQFTTRALQELIDDDCINQDMHNALAYAKRTGRVKQVAPGVYININNEAQA